jgi:hypothetical protein
MTPERETGRPGAATEPHRPPSRLAIATSGPLPEGEKDVSEPVALNDAE